MPKSFMQHQREIDRASDIELDMECIEQDMRESLLECQEFPLTFRNQFGVRVCSTFDLDRVETEMMTIDSDEFDAAMTLILTGEPVKGAQRMKELQKRAIEQLIGLAPIREAAEFTEMESAA